MLPYKRYETQFFTATILKWRKLLAADKDKDIVVDRLNVLTKHQRVLVHAFVIMQNHIHLVRQVRHPHLYINVQRDFLKYTAQKIKFDLQEHHAEILKYFYVNAQDRQYQFWQRNPLSVDVYTAAVLEQKMKYIHENPVRAGLVLHPTEHHYSSAGYYETGIDQFEFLSPP